MSLVFIFTLDSSFSVPVQHIFQYIGVLYSGHRCITAKWLMAAYPPVVDCHSGYVQCPCCGLPQFHCQPNLSTVLHRVAKCH